MDKRKSKRLWRLEVGVLCTAIIVFILLWRFPEFWSGLKTFLGYFETVIFGCIIAYIVNPLTEFLEKLFRGIKNNKFRSILAIFFSFVGVIILLGFALVTLVPQLVSSVESLIKNFDGYVSTLTAMLVNLGVSKNTFDLSSVVESSEDILKSVSDYVSENSSTILAETTNIGKGVLQWIIAIIVAVYFVAEKPKLKAGLKRFLKALLDDAKYQNVSDFLRKCNNIFKRYIIFSLIDALIIGIVNFIFMTIMGMENTVLVSFVVAVTNLIPTFGPFVGAAIGGFIVLMTSPKSALIFVIFTLILQLIDGYVIKPKLFGDTFGVSGLWIIVGVIIGGSMFGVVGILLAIPVVAVIDYIYRTYIITALEDRRKKHDTGC